MKAKSSFGDVIRLIRFAAILWIGYLVVLTIISQAFRDPRSGNIETLFYILLGCVALLCVGLAYWPWVQERLGRAFIPIIIAIITVLPITAAWVVITVHPGSPTLNSENLVLILLPFLLIGFLLIAWQYRWQYMLLIILGITALNVSVIWSFPPAGSRPPSPSFFLGAFTIPLIQIVVFLAVGFAISYLIGRLKNQQQSLETANIRLTHYASILEHLATSRERNRLARELHDTLAHTLSGLSVQLETVKAYWDVDEKMARSSLEKSLAEAHSGLEETRRALQALRASPLEDLGLAQAIRTMVESLTARANLILDLSIMDNLPALSPDVEQGIYRIAQEAVTNVINHANARKLTIKLESVDGKLRMTVGDDGVGFDTEKTSKLNRFGILGMRERAELIGGGLTATSKPGNGTTIQLSV